MKKTVRLLILFLAGLLLMSALASCKQDKDPSKAPTTDEAPSDNGDGMYDENGYLKDSLPEKHDFGAEYKIYTWTEMMSWEWCEELSAEPTTVEQALWNREQNVEERFGVEISRHDETGSWAARTQFIATLSNSVLGNDHMYDLVGQYTPCAGLAAVNGLYENLADNDYVDFTKPWWPSKITETATIGDKLYFATGDITPTLIRNVECMYVNTDLYESYQLAKDVNGKSIYDVVKDYEWTMETMMKMALNKVSVEEGNYGIAMLNEVMPDGFFYGGGFTYVENVDGIMTLSPDLSNNLLINWFDGVKDLFTNRYPDVAITGTDPFLQNKAIFYVGQIAESQQLSAEGVKFSILPMPLREAGQQEYRTCASFWVTMYGIPVDVKDFTMSGVILEALASEAYRTVSDEIYYNLFQMRYNGENEDSAKMFDILSDSVVFDTARFFPDELGLYAQFRVGVCDTAGNWSTIYGGNNETWTTKINVLYGKVG